MWVSDGGVARKPTSRSGRVGSHGAMTGANTATNTMVRMTRMARIEPGSRSSLRRAIAQVEVPRLGVCSSVTVVAGSLIADPRVDGSVKQVDDQVGDDEQHGRVDDERQHDRQVAVEERHQAVAAEPGQVEHEIGQGGAVDEAGQVTADDGEAGDQDVEAREVADSS